MFKDYYAILEIPLNCSQEEIRQAYKRQALRWHPDKNTVRDTTIEMQDINEAYLILNDIEARERYDKEYFHFSQYQEAHKEKEVYSNQEYEFDDEVLKKWMSNARKQSIEYVKQTLKDMGKLTVIASKAAGKRIIERTFAYIIVGIIILGLIKACGSI